MVCDVSLTCYSSLLAENFSVFLFLHCTTQCDNLTDGQRFDQLDKLDDLISKISTAYSPQANTVLSVDVL